jgi:hypothetical protein
VGTGLGIRNGHLGNAFGRWFLLDRTVLVQDAAVAMRGVFAKTDVSGDVQAREQGAKLFDRKDNGTIRVIGRGSIVILNRVKKL